jgi:hypothetical protein
MLERSVVSEVKPRAASEGGKERLEAGKGWLRMYL